MERKPAILVENVTKIYQSGEVINRVLDGVSFSVTEGEFVAVVGDSGSGKTTLMNLLGALDTPNSGKIIIRDKDISNMDQKQRTLYRRHHIGFIFQDYNLIQALNVYENIMLPLQLAHMDVEEDNIDTLLGQLHLSEKKYALPSRLSGGEQQRVGIIRALIHEPELILADEPTGNLDAKNTVMVVKLIQYLCRKRKRTTVLVTHNMQIARMCDRVICIQNGRVCEGKAASNISKAGEEKRC